MSLSYSFNRSSILQRVVFRTGSRVPLLPDGRLILSVFPGPYLIRAPVFFVVYCIAGVLGQATTNIRSSNVGPVWPAYGVALAAFLVCGYRVWPAIALGAFLVAFFSPVTHLAALGQAVGATLAAFSGAYLLHRIAEFDNCLCRLRDALALVLLGALGSALVSATIGVSVLYATAVHAYSGLGSTWLIYWLGDATGVLLVTPLILKLDNLLGLRKRTRITELAVMLVLLTTVCSLIFAGPNLIPVRLHVLAFAVLPFVMWAAIRFGVTGAAFSNVLIATIATLATAFGFGPFATGTPFTNAILLDAFFAVLSITGLTLASAIAEREQAERQQGALEARLATEQAVRISEERLRLAQQAAHIGTFERDVRTGLVTWTSELERMYGLPAGAFNGTTVEFFESIVHGDDRAGLRMLVDRALATGEPVQGEWRVIWPDGSVHWIAGGWQVLQHESGELRMLGVNMDVTERKLAEEALAGMSRKLIEAQEQERSRIGRELHDDINQRLAMLSVDLERLQGDPSAVQNSVEELRRRVNEISNDVQALSHDLHSSKLEYLGVVPGLKSWCREFSERQKIEIDFRSGVQSILPVEVGRTLFRVLQEALHNASKHSGVRRVEVQLKETPSEIHMIVGDSGRGFDVEAALQGTGLGLTSMRERIRLVNGTISIESKLKGGKVCPVFCVNDQVLFLGMGSGEGV